MNWSADRRRGSLNRRPIGRRGNHYGTRSRQNNRCRRNDRLRNRRSNHWPRHDGQGGRPGRRRNYFLLLRNRFENIPRTGDVRQIYLGLDLFFAAQRPGCFGSRRGRAGRAPDMRPHLLRFMLLERTGVCLLLGHSHERERVENSLALYFQLSGEIVDSNLAHPAFLYPAFCLGLHFGLTESIVCVRAVAVRAVKMTSPVIPSFQGLRRCPARALLPPLP